VRARRLRRRRLPPAGPTRKPPLPKPLSLFSHARPASSAQLARRPETAARLRPRPSRGEPSPPPPRFPPLSFFGVARRDPSTLLSLASASAMAPFAPGARGPIQLGAAGPGAALASARPGSLPPRGVPDPLPMAPGSARGPGPRPGAAPPRFAPGPALLPRVRPPRRAPLRSHGARARPRLDRPRAPSSARRARAASPVAQLPAPFGPSLRSGRHGAAWRVSPCPWRPACARPTRVPRRGLELGPACLWHAALSSASTRPACSALACARPVHEALARPCARMLAWCARCFGVTRRALGALVYPPRRARLPPCIPCVVITLFNSVNGNSI
jgi:hypothetical protein